MQEGQRNHSNATAKRVASRVNGQRLTRRRIPLSCVSCRTRKLKCNREKPCQNCVVRGETDATSCTYAEKIQKKNAGPLNHRSDAETMRKRINRLESSILSMIDPKTSASENSLSPASNVTSSTASQSQAGGQKISRDTRSTHWDTILNELGAMKDAWSAENDKIDYINDSTTPRTTSGRLGLLNGLGELPEHEAILSTLPPKEDAYRLVMRFYACYNPSNPGQFLLHRPTFLKQCERHWANPSETKIIWIGLFYGVLCLAMQSYGPLNDIPEEYANNYPETTDFFRVRCAQCITIADITKPVEFMIEALTLYAMTEYTNQSDGDMGTWLVSGIMVRLALQQGYHRDPSEHPGISIFQAEMRRRVWHVVNSHDLIFSGLVGLPKSVKTAEYDTLPISNLHEEELFEEMTVMPPSRPLTESTFACYQVAKMKILRGYALVLEFLHALQPQPYEEVLRLDHFLREGRDEIPAHLVLRTLEDMKVDPPFRIMEKYILQHFYHKTTCVLHRKFWDRESTSASDSTLYYSRRACVSSALALLQQQVLLHRGCQPGGALASMRWYQFAILNHDFLLAAMILSLDVMDMRRGTHGSVAECGYSEEDKMALLVGSREVWQDIVNESRDARRAVRVLDAVIKKVTESCIAKKPMDIRSLTTLTVPTTMNNTHSNGFVQGGAESMFGGYSMSTSGYNMDMQDNLSNVLGTDLTVPQDFNWDAWDNFILTQPQPYEMGPTHDIQVLYPPM